MNYFIHNGRYNHCIDVDSYKPKMQTIPVIRAILETPVNTPQCLKHTGEGGGQILHLPKHVTLKRTRMNNGLLNSTPVSIEFYRKIYIVMQYFAS